MQDPIPYYPPHLQLKLSSGFSPPAFPLSTTDLQISHPSMQSMCLAYVMLDITMLLNVMKLSSAFRYLFSHLLI
jgi:hypothetical protein